MGKYTVHRKDGNHDAIREGLEAVGASVIADGPGDLLAGYRGATYILEVKTAKGRVRPSQERFKAGWRGHYAVVRSVDEALVAIGARLPEGLRPKS